MLKMTIREWMIKDGEIRDPDNYVALNFATDSIKSNAIILQLAFVHKGVLENYYCLGGDPKVNFEFTKIDLEHYHTFGLDRRKVEERICEAITSNGVEYIVYNNDFWNKRLVANNNWGHLNRLMLQLPCFPISEYEALRHWNNQILSDLGAPVKRNFASIPDKTKSLPKGRTPLEKIVEERGMELPQEYDGRSLVTKTELNVMSIDAIMKDILRREQDKERYSTQMLEKDNGRSLERLADAQPGGVCKGDEAVKEAPPAKDTSPDQHGDNSPKSSEAVGQPPAVAPDKGSSEGPAADAG
jgi:hypothetical protein